MFYQVLDILLKSHELEIATDGDVKILDEYLASLSAGQSSQISPWRVANKTGINQESVFEVFLKASKAGLLSIKYEVWHPESRVKIFETFNKDTLSKPIENDESDPILASDDDIKVSFRLNDVKGEQKKKPLPLTSNTSSTSVNSLPSEPTLADIKAHPQLGNVYNNCTFNVHESGSNFSTTNAHTLNNPNTSFSGYIDNSQNEDNSSITTKTKNIDKSVHQNFNQPQIEKGIFSKIIEHPVISGVIATLISALIVGTVFWKNIEKIISNDESEKTSSVGQSSADKK